MASTKMLIEVLKGRFSNSVELEPLMELASKNKVLLELMDVLGIRGVERRHQEASLMEVVRVVRMLSMELQDFEYSFFKMLKPLRYVPADVDVLVDQYEVEEIAKRIMRWGFKVVVREPYCITFVNKSSIIDLYVHPTIGGVIYLNGQRLLEHVKKARFYGFEIRTLEDYAEALVTAAHAIYKEGIYTLNDYFTVKEFIGGESFKLANELKCRGALELAININEKVEEGLLELPYKLPTSLWFKFLLQKILEDDLTRTTLTNLLKALFSKRFGRLLISKFTRETY